MLALFAITLAAFVAKVLCSNGDGLLVETTLGKMQGHYNELDIKEWKGIRYSRAPVGEFRWTQSQFPEPSSDVYDANYNAFGCQQTCNLPPGNCPEYGQSEDCLFLTVMSPKEPSTDPAGYPVLLWLHGGAFEQGLGNSALYNGSTFAQKGIVTVVINYRLGAFGFMASKSMEGNYGLLDQRLAMQWTKLNIAGFGGNPSKLTIAGQSAGAMSVSCHMISPNSAPFFDFGIMESNPYGLPYHTRDSAATNANSMAKYLGCVEDDTACMRSKSVDQILDAQNHAVKLNPNTLFINFLPFAPMVEPGGELPDQPLYAMAAGKFKPVPSIVAGTVYDEGLLFVYELFPKSIPKVYYNSFMDLVFGKNSKEVKIYYPFDLIEGNEDGRDVLSVMATDLLFYCPLRNVTRGYQSALASQAPKTFIYRFKHVLSFDAWGANYTFCVGVVCHGSDLPFVFNVFDDGTNIYYPTSDEKQLSVDMNNAWTNFFNTLNPNGPLPVPADFLEYSSVADGLVVLDEPGSENQYHVRDSYCDLWDRIGYFY